MARSKQLQIKEIYGPGEISITGGQTKVDTFYNVRCEVGFGPHIMNIQDFASRGVLAFS